jgi:malate dehydrogenase (oxaloacetate-decarboxylating)(NADP+)
MPTDEEILAYHKRPRPGKIEVVPTKPCMSQADLCLAYTQGVGLPCLKIKSDPDFSYDYTDKANLVEVITNGTAVLGLANTGALAGKRA